MRAHILVPLLLAIPLGLAGCLTSTEVPVEEAQAPPLVVAPSADVPVLFDGSIGAGVLACPFITCIGIPGTSADSYRKLEDLTGPIGRVNLTMTWDASSPLTRELGLGLLACAGECSSYEDVGKWVEVVGTSPLVLELDSFPLGPDEFLYVYASPASLLPIFAAVTTSQDFHIEGTIGAGAPEAMAGEVPADDA